MAKFSYVAQQYTQGEGSLRLLNFCADASDVLRWGGVPSKNERFHGGFQRALSARYRKIIEYFNAGQSSPGAIVVAFRPGVVGATKLGYPPAWPQEALLTKPPEFVHVEFSAEEDDDLTTAQLIEKVKKILEGRPGFPAVESPDAQSEAEGEVGGGDDESSTALSASEDDSDEEDSELDVGQSKLRAFYDFISNAAAVDAWKSEQAKKIDAIKAKKTLSKAEREFVAFTPEERIRATLTSLTRPAMIVDGQHRVNGANESDKDGIVFTVCAIEDADWVEQVFQFVVLNRMAKPISRDFLTELLNTSLTNKEIDEIDKRLEIIGIRNADRRIHKYINHDPRSPFAGLIAEAGEVAGVDTSGKLSQQGMLALAKRWRSISLQGHTKEMNSFLRYLGVSGLTDARKEWADYEKWMALFFAFWDEVRKIYLPQQVWVKQEKYHLLYIVTLQALQELFIESKAAAKVKFESIEDFRGQVKDFFVDVPAAFFLNWSQTGLQSGTGWKDIKDAVQMFQNGSTLPNVQKESPLFK